MTRCNKPVRRIFDSVLIFDRGKMKRVIVTMYPNGTLGLRLEKTKREEGISIKSVFDRAIKQRVAKEEFEKRKAKAEKAAQHATERALSAGLRALKRRPKKL